MYATSVGLPNRPIHLKIRERAASSGRGVGSPEPRLGRCSSADRHGGIHQVVCVSSPGAQRSGSWEPGPNRGIRGPGARVDSSMAFQQSHPPGGLDWARAIFRRYGDGQLAPFGSWSLAAAGLLALIAGGLSIWLLVRGPPSRASPPPPGPGFIALLRRTPAAAWLCALVAVLNATAWSLIVPIFQGGDERDTWPTPSTLPRRDRRHPAVPRRPTRTRSGTCSGLSPTARSAIALTSAPLSQRRTIGGWSESPHSMARGSARGAPATPPTTHLSTTRSNRSPIALLSGQTCSHGCTSCASSRRCWRASLRCSSSCS